MPRVLIVDDEEILRLAMELILDSEGYQTVSVQNGTEALAMVGRETFDLVITDMKMPGVNGMDVLRGVKSISPATKVIIITGFAAEDPSTAIRDGADDFIYKVFTRAQFLEAINRLIGPGRSPS
jgi:DNA-binding NtrC family response regulator